MIALAAGLAALLCVPGGEEEELRRKARAILADNCFDCHGPDAHARKAKLRLDVEQGFQAKRKGLPILAPGSPEKSELFVRVTAADPEDRMPPPESGRKLDASQIAVLREWIGRGGTWGKHWAFVPPEPGAVPKTSKPEWARTFVDAFILKKLESRGLSPSPEADRLALIRRLYLDLLGLPPSVEEADRFARECSQENPDAVVARWVDRLLASPHYGERWGRHWLDLARYGDSDGFEDDQTRPDAWRFRDWVIGAINRDQPFDRFTIEQIAGDLLDDPTPDQKTAAGFYRMATFNRIAVGRKNEEEFRVKYVKERVTATGTLWLGLTIGCAECHDHKYDPLPQRDFYRFYAFFNNLEDATVPAPPLPERYTREYEEALQAFEKSSAAMKAAKKALELFEKDEMPGRIETWAAEADRGNMPPDVAAILSVKPAERNSRELDRLTSYFRTIDPEYKRLKKILVQSEELANNKPHPPSVAALTVTERAERRKTFLQVRGNFEDPGEELVAGVPSCLPSPAKKPWTRLDLARWIADPANPLTARVAVNHVWKQLFGTGLVATPENFGAQGDPPTHPELLDALAVAFTEAKWSRKELIRILVTSSTYRQSSKVRKDAAEIDPENKLLWRQNRLRVEAEIVRDLGLAAGGILNLEAGGPGIQPMLPGSLLNRTELVSERLMMPSRGPDRYRRGIYVNVQRTFPYPMLKDFDAADPNAPCPRRDRSISPQQALTLLNDPVYAECARAVGLRVVRESAGTADRIERAFRICLVRPPKESERKLLREAFEKYRALYERDPERVRALLESVEAPDGVSRAELAAWSAVGRTLLNTDEFITRE